MDNIATPHPDRAVKQSYPIRGRIRGWFFRVEELPTGHWHARGRDRHGRTVSCVGENPEDVLASAETEAKIASNKSAAPTY